MSEIEHEQIWTALQLIHTETLTPFDAATLVQQAETENGVMLYIPKVSEAVIEILRNHIFNWAIWPDFSEIPSVEAPRMRFQTIKVGQKIKAGGMTVTALPAEHTVPAVGYLLDSGRGSLAFTGDTTLNDRFWPVVNKVGNLRHLIIECAFSNREEQLARISKHLCPSMLAAELQKLERTAEIHITHLKPGQIELTMGELEACVGDFQPRMLQNNQVLEF